MIIRDVALLSAVGATLGLAAYMGVSRVVGSFLFGLSATDPSTVAAATIAMTAVAFAAGLVPARRAGGSSRPVVHAALGVTGPWARDA